MRVIEQGIAAHFCMSDRCRYHRATVIIPDLTSDADAVIVSTIGCLLLDNGRYEEIGFNRHFETFVFKAKLCDEVGCCCDCYIAIIDDGEIDTATLPGNIGPTCFGRADRMHGDMVETWKRRLRESRSQDEESR